MLHLNDEQLQTLLEPVQVQAVLEAAFSSLGKNEAAQQRRVRTEVDGFRLSTLGAVIPEQKVAGAKVYTTLDGAFNFVIVLFDTDTGQLVATLQAGTITQLRTAACSVLAARRCANPQSGTLGVFGLGAQGWAHAVQFSQAYPIHTILVCTPRVEKQKLEALATLTGATVQQCRASEVAQKSDIIVTASRSKTPLFDGHLVKPGSFIAAVGSSVPSARELDDVLMTRAKHVVVEWAQQTLAEAGDVLLADHTCGIEDKIIEMAQLMGLENGQLYDPAHISVYKSVGVALEDIAVAGLALRQYQRSLSESDCGAVSMTT